MMIRTADDIQLSVRIEGAGQDVLLLHSLGADHHVWDAVVTALNAEYRVIVPDARGHGRSGRGTITLETQVEDIVAILDTLAIPRAHVAGISMGGVEALALAGDHPERVRSLALLDTFAALGQARATQWVQDKIEQLARTSMEDFGRQYGDTTLMPQTSSAARGTLAEAVSSMTAADYIAASRACFEADLDQVLPTLRVPTLVMIGKHDLRTPLELSQHLVEHIATARFRSIPAAGHLSAVDNPVVVADALLAFWRSIDT